MTGPYSRWIGDYRDSGIHPFPVDGKRPPHPVFWARKPSPAALERWRVTFPHANLGLPTQREGLVVLDADDPAAIALFKDIAGYTPLRVQTRPRTESGASASGVREPERGLGSLAKAGT